MRSDILDSAGVMGSIAVMEIQCRSGSGFLVPDLIGRTEIHKEAPGRLQEDAHVQFSGGGCVINSAF